MIAVHLVSVDKAKYRKLKLESNGWGVDVIDLPLEKTKIISKYYGGHRIRSFLIDHVKVPPISDFYYHPIDRDTFMHMQASIDNTSSEELKDFSKDISRILLTADFEKDVVCFMCTC